MKTSDLLPVLFQLNLLFNLKNERCMLLIFCKMIAYALRADPKKRFASMEDVLELLKWCDPSDLDENIHVGEPLLRTFQFPTTYYAEAKSRHINGFETLVQSFELALGFDSPLTSALREARRERYLAEIDMFMSKPGPLDIDTYLHCPGMELMLLRTRLLALSPAGTASTRSALKRCGKYSLGVPLLTRQDERLKIY